MIPASKRAWPILLLLASVLAAGMPVEVQADSFVYVVNRISGSISGYTIDDDTGSLTSVPGSPFITGLNPLSIAAHPTGRFAYVATASPPNLWGYAVEPEKGTLLALDDFPFLLPEGGDPTSVAVEPRGQFLYVARRGPPGILQGFSINAQTGALSELEGSPFPAAEFPFSVTVEATGRFAYVAHVQPARVSAYAVDPDTGALTQIPGSPYLTPEGSTPFSVAVDPFSRFVYLPNSRFGDEVLAFAIDAETGGLTRIAGAPLRAGESPTSVAIDPAGKYVYVANFGRFFVGSVSVFVIDPETGALREIGGSPFPSGAGARAVAVHPDGMFLYVANSIAGNVSGFFIDHPTGILIPVPGSPFPAGTDPISVAITMRPKL